MSSIKGQDLNGMQAVAWKPADVGGIASVKVAKNCSQSELFDAIKKIVAESVKILRADCTDDKYKNIVNLIMLRVRGALQKTIEDVEEALPEIDIDKIVENISRNVKSKIDVYLESQKLDLNQFAENLVQTLEMSFQTKLDDSLSEFKTGLEQQFGEQFQLKENKLQTPNDVVSAPKTSTVSSTTIVGISPKNFETLQTAIDKSIVALEDSIARLSTISTLKPTEVTSTSKQPKTRRVVKVDLKNLGKLQSKIDSTIVTLEKHVEKLKPTAQPTLIPKPVESKASTRMPKGFKKLFNLQWNRLLDIIDKQRASIEESISRGSDTACKRLDSIDKKIAEIQKKLNEKSGFSILNFIFLISLFVIPFFKDKIVEILKAGKDWVYEKLGQLLNNPILQSLAENAAEYAKISWNAVTNLIKENVLEKFNAFISSPLKSIVGFFKGSYNEFVKFKDTVFGWFNKQKQDADDEKIEIQDQTKEIVEYNLFDPLNKMTCLVDADLDSIQKTSTDSVSQMSEAMTGAQTQVSEQVDNLQAKTDDAISKTTSELDQESQKISQNVIPGMQQTLEQNTNDALDKQQSSLDQSIKGVEQNVNDQIEKAEKVVEKNGAPTGITTESLDKLEQEASKDGGAVKTTNNASMKQPQSIEQTTVTEQNKQVALYTKKGETSRATQESVEVNKFQQLYYNNNSSSTTNLQIGQDLDPKIENNVTAQIVVDGNSPELESKSPSSNVSKAMQQLVQHSSKIEAGLLESGKLLNDLKGTVNRYFELLDKGIQDIVSKELDQANPNTLILLANSGNGNQALMET